MKKTKQGEGANKLAVPQKPQKPGKRGVPISITEEEVPSPLPRSGYVLKYAITGNFEADFAEACRSMPGQMYVPSIVPRPRQLQDVEQQPQQPQQQQFLQVGKDDKRLAQSRKSVIKKGTGLPKVSGIPAVMDEADGKSEATAEAPEYQTFVTKRPYEVFMPTIQVEKDIAEQPNSVTAMYIRGWRVTMETIGALESCCHSLENLHTMNLWNVGLTSDSVSLLSYLLPMFPNLKIMSLDANPVDEQNYDLLITGGAIQQISLRHCRVTDGGAGRIGMALGTATKVNTKLLSLDLAGNLITDVGAGDLAKGLRLNRTLLTLSLANNKIEDKGAIMLAEALSRFALNHDELVERRRLIFIRECNRKASKPKAAHYCTSWTRYGRRHAIFGSLGGVRRGSAFAPDDADHEKVERSRSLSHTGLRAPSFGERDAPRGSFLAKKKTEHSPKGAKEEPKNKGHEDAGSKKGKDDTKSKGKKTPRGKKKVAVEIEVVEDEPLADSATTPGSPSRPPAVLEDMVKASGQHWASGNLVLISLNLSRNRIGEEGLWSLLKTIQYQCLTCPTSPYGDKGLLRLCLHKNKVGSDNHVLQRIDEIMRARDPTILTDPEASTGAADYPH